MVIIMSKIIGVVPLWDEKKESVWMIPGYLEGIINSGGVPIILPFTDDKDVLKRSAELCGGFLLTGGQDVDPEIYGEKAVPECGVPCKVRDNMEAFLLNIAINENKPLLGICRGIQFMNAALGGTLYQDIPTQYDTYTIHCQKPPYDVPVHNVTVQEDSPLFEVIRRTEVSVNSYHHQAVKTLSDKLRPMAYSEDGLIEAVYMPDRKFIWAVQWHPELNFKVEESSADIFKHLIFNA